MVNKSLNKRTNFLFVCVVLFSITDTFRISAFSLIKILFMRLVLSMRSILDERTNEKLFINYLEKSIKI